MEQTNTAPAVSAAHKKVEAPKVPTTAPSCIVRLEQPPADVDTDIVGFGVERSSPLGAIAFCLSCDLPLVNICRLMPCQHAFCEACGGKAEVCPRCQKAVEKHERFARIREFFVCSVPSCMRGYITEKGLLQHQGIRHPGSNLIPPPLIPKQYLDHLQPHPQQQLPPPMMPQFHQQPHQQGMNVSPPPTHPHHQMPPHPPQAFPHHLASQQQPQPPPQQHQHQPQHQQQHQQQHQHQPQQQQQQQQQHPQRPNQIPPPSHHSLDNAHHQQRTPHHPHHVLFPQNPYHSRNMHYTNPALRQQQQQQPAPPQQQQLPPQQQQQQQPHAQAYPYHPNAPNSSGGFYPHHMQGAGSQMQHPPQQQQYAQRHPHQQHQFHQQ